jgi:Na+/H+ antiporter NhaD/arsenite permease-like protein
MLFILGLTFFVSVIAQTRLLEGITFFLLRRYQGAILPTVIAVTAVVAVASGILDGVSMIGLTIRTLVIILMLAAAPTDAIRYAVMVCTAVTTICGIWLAYGEPPNLIMKANLHPYLDNAFFLRYCAPAAVASYLVIALQLRKKLGGQRVNLETMDVIDANAEDVRFLQATRHGEVITPVELVESHAADLGDKTEPVSERLRHGESLGIALVHESVPEITRKKLLGHFVSEDLADALDRHYLLTRRPPPSALEAESVDETPALGRSRQLAQRIGALALSRSSRCSSCMASTMRYHYSWRRLPVSSSRYWALSILPRCAPALREAKQEYADIISFRYSSITLLTKAGFFDQLQSLIQRGIETVGHGHVAFAQFMGCTFLSAILDNNVVADFASRALHGLDISILHLFAFAQIAGYALGGCWTHIGCAQSVVAFAFIQRDVDEHYTPIRWIKEMTPVIIKIFVLLTVIIYLESFLLDWLD